MNGESRALRCEMFMDTGVLNQTRLTALIWFWALALLKS